MGKPRYSNWHKGPYWQEIAFELKARRGNYFLLPFQNRGWITFAKTFIEEIYQKKGKIELLDDLISSAQNEIAHLPNIVNHDLQLSILEKKIRVLKEDHITLKNEFVELDRRRKVLSQEIAEPISETIYFDELLLRSKILNEQYKSDINRLKATMEASSLLVGQHTFTNHCPLCQSELKDNCSDDDIVQIMEACKQEINKIQLLVTELLKSELLISSERQTAVTKSNEVQLNIDRISQQLDEDLSVKMSRCIDELNDANNERNELTQLKFQVNRIDNFKLQKDFLENTYTSSGGNQFGKLSTASVTELSLILKSILQGANYPNLTSVSFSEDKKDFVISGENRGLFGKGYRAITYASFILALQDYVSSRNYSLGVPVLDSPLVTYKKPKYDKADIIPIDLAMDFYRYAASDTKIAQLLIFENEEPPEDISHLIHHEKFTQSTHEGRYGFFPI